MKLEHVTIDDMLRSYLKSNFANRNTLVIWPLSMCDSEAEVETIKQDLFEFGYLPPKSYCRNGFWIIEMPTHTRALCYTLSYKSVFIAKGAVLHVVSLRHKP